HTAARHGRAERRPAALHELDAAVQEHRALGHPVYLLLAAAAHGGVVLSAAALHVIVAAALDLRIVRGAEVQQCQCAAARRHCEERLPAALHELQAAVREHRAVGDAIGDLLGAAADDRAVGTCGVGDRLDRATQHGRVDGLAAGHDLLQAAAHRRVEDLAATLAGLVAA